VASISMLHGCGDVHVKTMTSCVQAVYKLCTSCVHPVYIRCTFRPHAYYMGIRRVCRRVSKCNYYKYRYHCDEKKRVCDEYRLSHVCMCGVSYTRRLRCMRNVHRKLVSLHIRLFIVVGCPHVCNKQNINTHDMNPVICYFDQFEQFEHCKHFEQFEQFEHFEQCAHCRVHSTM
jgi:hypothetical protein